jgi:hypothetical protein
MVTEEERTLRNVSHACLEFFAGENLPAVQGPRLDLYNATLHELPTGDETLPQMTQCISFKHPPVAARCDSPSSAILQVLACDRRDSVVIPFAVQLTSWIKVSR